ncbi:protein sprouty, partial [Hetaerina americana]|uniref:protein sprouty n=1 Tax=Hetaerina americana TaxID=62018 RepID=UPI003A7F5326
SRRRPPPPPPEGVTLEAPRLDGERVTNEYVETPFRASDHHHPHHQQQHQQHHQQHQSHLPAGARRVPSSGAHDGPRRAPGVARRAVAPEALRPSLLGKLQQPQAPSPASPPVTKQPTASPPLLPAAAAAAATFTKDGPRTAGRNAAGSDCAVGREGVGGASIICPACGRCRCASCRTPRPLPSAWLCRDSCFCSAETTVDYASCLCCVKGLFYHCGGKEGYEGGSGATSCADDPCSCAPPRRCLRWACLCALTAALPCLLCYWPLRGVAGAVERCYGRYAGHGCRCQTRTEAGGVGGGGPGGPLGSRGAGGDLTPEKRLLASSPDY